VTFAGDGEMEDDLLARGYALAGTRYRDDGVLLDGVSDTLNLIRYVRDVVVTKPAVLAAGAFRRLILVGCSLGGAHVARIAETSAAPVDGVITLGLPGAGLPRTADYLLAFQLAYDVVFGWPPDWGRVGDVRNADGGRQDDLDWEEETLPRVAQQSADARNRGRFEFIRLVLGLPFEGFYPGQAVDPGNIPWLYAVTLLASEAAADAEHRLEGVPYRNVAHRYSLSQSQTEYLRSLDPALDSEGLLARMNAQTTYRADGPARARLDQALGLEGRIQRPMIGMHNTADGIMPAWQANVYRRMVEDSGHGALLVQLFVRRASHCAFTVPQVTSAVAAMEAWIDSGRRPTPNASPAGTGFAHDYVPPPWPFGR
jgi:pimeloyl-ACP methyl ester carboxylesterase